MPAEILNRLFSTIQSRKGADPQTSYTAKLFSKGTGRIAQKVGEEAVETVIAATAKDKEHVISESADLLYHLCVCGQTRAFVPTMCFMFWNKGKAFPA